MSPRKRNPSSSPDEDDYRKKRERNNLAVKKCRIKSNEQAKKIKAQTEELKSKNKILKGRIQETEENIQSAISLIRKKDCSQEVEAKIKEIMESGRETREEYD